MSENITKLYTTQFSTNLEMRLQQTSSKLRGKVAEGSHTGKQASPVQYLGPVKLKAPAGRFAPKNRTDADFERRWVFPQDGEIDQLIDSFDELKTIVDPKSQYGTNAAAAVGRAWDDAVIGCAFAPAMVGQDAAALSTENFDTSKFQIADTFGSSAASGLTVAKLIEAKRILRRYENDLEIEDATVICGSQQESDLLGQVEVVSKEFNDKPVLVDGKITRFMGFNIVFSERLTSASSLRHVIVTMKSGLYLGMWKDMMSRASIRNDLSGEPWDLWTAVAYGATRLQAGKTLRLLCADTTGASITP